MTTMPSITTTIHNPAMPVVTEVPRDSGETWFLSVNIGTGATLFFDTVDDLLKWHNALAAEMGALRHPPTGDTTPVTIGTGWADRFRAGVRG